MIDFSTYVNNALTVMAEEAVAAPLTSMSAHVALPKAPSTKLAN